MKGSIANNKFKRKKFQIPNKKNMQYVMNRKGSRINSQYLIKSPEISNPKRQTYNNN